MIDLYPKEITLCGLLYYLIKRVDQSKELRHSLCNSAYWSFPATEIILIISNVPSISRNRMDVPTAIHHSSSTLPFTWAPWVLYTSFAPVTHSYKWLCLPDITGGNRNQHLSNCIKESHFSGVKLTVLRVSDIPRHWLCRGAKISIRIRKQSLAWYGNIGLVQSFYIWIVIWLLLPPGIYVTYTFPINLDLWSCYTLTPADGSKIS